MNVLVSIILVASSFPGFVSLDPPKVKSRDLQILMGAQWIGTLTYLDYSRNKPVSIPSKLTVTQSKGDKLSWVFEYQYPDEPKANSEETVTISKDGKTIGGETVVERTKLAGNTLRIVTEKNGMDDNKKSLFRHTYLINANNFSIRKEVRFEGTAEFFERNQYSWRR